MQVEWRVTRVRFEGLSALLVAYTADGWIVHTILPDGREYIVVGWREIEGGVR